MSALVCPPITRCNIVAWRSEAVDVIDAQEIDLPRQLERAVDFSRAGLMILALPSARK